jgi:hypothetical protein
MPAMGNANGFSKTPYATPKSVVVAPMPSAIASTAATAYPGSLRSTLKVCRKWLRIETHKSLAPA